MSARSKTEPDKTDLGPNSLPPLYTNLHGPLDNANLSRGPIVHVALMWLFIVPEALQCVIKPRIAATRPDLSGCEASRPQGFLRVLVVIMIWFKAGL